MKYKVHATTPGLHGFDRERVKTLVQDSQDEVYKLRKALEIAGDFDYPTEETTEESGGGFVTTLTITVDEDAPAFDRELKRWNIPYTKREDMGEVPSSTEEVDIYKEQLLGVLEGIIYHRYFDYGLSQAVDAHAEQTKERSVDASQAFTVAQQVASEMNLEHDLYSVVSRATDEGRQHFYSRHDFGE